MSFIGFELISLRSLSILPNDTFHTSILWNEKKISSSIGKDRYHEQGLILPNKPFAATGRIHHFPTKTSMPFQSWQTSPCLLIQCPADRPFSLHLEVFLSNKRLMGVLEQSISLCFLRKDDHSIERIPIYLDPQSVKKKQPCNLLIDLSFLTNKHW